jgi:phosphoribosylaminoimidazole-succinocarboxamide synthase
MTVMTTIDIPQLALFKTGKVRSVFDLGDTLLLVTSDRVSAFDVILPNGIPGKGAILTQMTEFWCDFFKNDVPHHLISTNFSDFPEEVQPYKQQLEGRSLWVKKTQLIEIECVARGYLAGTGWKEYQQSGTVCGIPLPAGLRLADKLPEPIFTPAFKAEVGQHDENISFEKMVSLVGQSTADTLKNLTLKLFNKASEYALSKGLVLADTKFEFGFYNGEITLIDEVLTADSSRYWDVHAYKPGISPPSFDKQIIRDYLDASGWDKHPPAPPLPADIISKTASRYQDVLNRLNY